MKQLINITFKAFIRIARLIKLNTFSRKKISLIRDFFKNNFEKSLKSNSKGVILLDTFSAPEWVIANSYLTNILAEETQSTIKTFGKFSRLESPFNEVIFNSFNVAGHINTTLKNKKLIAEKNTIVLNLRKNIQTKSKLFDLKVNNIWIGIDIYETYLKRGVNATINFEDEFLWEIVDEAIELLLFWSDYINNNNNIYGVALGHDCYIQTNILAKISYTHNIPVYLVFSKGMQKVDAPFFLKTRFENYKKHFNLLPIQEKSKGIAWSKNRLEKRLSGDVGVDIPYSKISAFKEPDRSKKVMRSTNKIKILIAVHDFYDNPHCYDSMLFTDFYVWLEFLVSIANQTDYDWYIKTHPDTSQHTLDTLNDGLINNSRIELIPKETSFQQLAKEGLDFALTCYGSIGHELPLLGIKVINAAPSNPHMSYNFNYHAKSVDGYKNTLLNLPSLVINVDINEIYEFYYMHYYYTNLDDFIYDSHSQMLADLSENSRLSLDAYIYFIKNLSKEKNEEIQRKIKDFIKSGKRNYFNNGPQDFN